MLAPIHSKKHIVPQGAAITLIANITNIPIALAVDLPSNVTAQEVAIGSVIKAVYVEMWIRGDDESPAPANFAVSLEKLEGAATPMTFTQSTVPNVYPNKANLFYMTQGLTSAGTANSAIPVMRGWFKIPKGFQRMALGDQLILNVSALNHDIERCGLFIYKEYQ